MMPTLDAALLCSSRAGSDLGRESGLGLKFSNVLNCIHAFAKCILLINSP